jgi:Leucine-rich repeat (LRR) protein
MAQNLKYGFWNLFELEKVKTCTRVEEYKGEENLALTITQLADKKEQTKIVKDWCQLLQTQQLPAKKIWVRTRISQPIFDAICFQKNLEGLWIKWGVYPDISNIAKLKNLEYLHLGGGTSITDISAIATLKKLKSFEADNLVGIHDYSLLTSLKNIVDLLIEGDAYSSMKPATLTSLKFLESMPQIQRLSLAMTKVEDRSYLPILKIKSLKYLELPNNRDVQKDIKAFGKFIK